MDTTGDGVVDTLIELHDSSGDGHVDTARPGARVKSLIDPASNVAHDTPTEAAKHVPVHHEAFP